MTVYAIGDVQGCYDPLRQLLDQVRFDPSKDRLWFTGDLVNRGPRSLDVVRFVRALGDSAVVVLGNHDLTLLAVWQGAIRAKRRDTFREILQAPDAHELLQWLRYSRLMHHDVRLGWAMVHAGLPPQWSMEVALGCARELEAVLRNDDFAAFLASMYGDQPDSWSDDLVGFDRLRCITNCLTRIRYCTAEGRLCLRENGPPGTQPKGLIPWFQVPGRRSLGQRIVFGHWAALGYRNLGDVLALDSGCVWGNQLTAVRLDGALQSWCVSCRRDG